MVLDAFILFLFYNGTLNDAAAAAAASDAASILLIDRRCTTSTSSLSTSSSASASASAMLRMLSSRGRRMSRQHALSKRNVGLLFVTPFSRQLNARKMTPASSSPRKLSSTKIITLARNRNSDYDDNDDDNWRGDYDDDDDDDYEDDDAYYNNPPPLPRRRRRRSRQRRPSIDNLGTPPLTGSSPDDTSLSIPSPFGRGDTGLRLPSSVSAALLAGVFVLGMGTGVTVDSQINTNPRDLASRDAVDKNAPNPTLCTTYGASAMAFDQRVFVSFNPFNVYVAQADVKPACVLRPANIVPVLKERKLLNDDEIRSCKMNMNTWAFVGDLNDQPQLSCVYKSEDAQNEFLDDPKRGIGEDYLDDDVKKMMQSSGTRKMVKDNLTEGQKKMVLDMGGAGGTR